MEFEQIDVTGCRIVGAINDIGHIGPKHHGIIIGRHVSDNQVYIAENMHTGYQLATYEDFHSRYATKGEIKIFENDGKFDSVTVAKRALSEIVNGGKGVYNLVTNNCESFANRAIKDHSISSQVVNTAIGVLAIAGIYWVVKNRA